MHFDTLWLHRTQAIKIKQISIILITLYHFQSLRTNTPNHVLWSKDLISSWRRHFFCSPFYMCLTGLRYQGQLYLDKSRKILSSCNRQLVSACVRVVFHRHQIDAVLMKNQSSGKVVKTTNYCPINGKLRLAQVISDVNGLFLELHHHLHEYSQETAWCPVTGIYS